MRRAERSRRRGEGGVHPWRLSSVWGSRERRGAGLGRPARAPACAARGRPCGALCAAVAGNTQNRSVAGTGFPPRPRTAACSPCAHTHPTHILRDMRPSRPTKLSSRVRTASRHGAGPGRRGLHHLPHLRAPGCSGGEVLSLQSKHWQCRGPGHPAAPADTSARATPSQMPARPRAGVLQPTSASHFPAALGP